jgi:hypothetical protein
LPIVSVADADLTSTQADDGVFGRARNIGVLPLAVGLLVLLAVPLVVALVHLSERRWYPVLDLAMTELRVRDVGTSHTPLIGLPGRIGELPDQGSHPGPLSFWVLAPTYRLLGQTAFSLEVGTVLVHLVAAAVILWCGSRIAGRMGVLLTAVMLAVVMRGYGTLLLVQPWNPYFPLLAWLLVLWATVAVLAGHHRWLIAVVAAGTFCAQTHIPYLVMSIGMCALAFATVGVRAWRSGSGPQRGAELRSVTLAAGVGVLLWLPPIVEELFGNGEGNISRLIDHFGSPPQDSIGLGDAASIVLRHLNVWDSFVGLLHGSQRFMQVGLDDTAARWPGVFVLVVWSAAFAVAARLGSPRLLAMHTVVAVGLALALVSTARIFGTPWFYLTLWIWGITALLLVAVAATLLVAIRTRRPSWASLSTTVAAVAGVALLVASTVAFTVDASDAEHAEQHLSDELGPLIEPTYEAMMAGTGPANGLDDRYIVRWSDSHFFGSQAYGLVNELDRLGVDVGGEGYFHVPLTEHRTFARSPQDPAATDRPLATVQVHFATGAYVDDWRQVPSAIEVATVDLRSDEERADYARLRQQLIDELASNDLDELVPLVDRNVFGLAERSELSREGRFAAGQMLQIGTESAVFLAPVGADAPATS